MSDPYLEELTRRNKELAAAQEESGKPEGQEDTIPSHTFEMPHGLVNGDFILVGQGLNYEYQDGKLIPLSDSMIRVCHAARPGAPEPVAWRYKLVGTDEWCDASLDANYVMNHPHVSEVESLYLGAPAATPEVTGDMVERAVEAWKGERYYLGTDDSMKRLARAVLRAALEGGEKP